MISAGSLESSWLGELLRREGLYDADLRGFFRTVKYQPEYPKKPYARLEAAREWVARFVAWYNDVRLHSGIGYVTGQEWTSARGCG